MTANDRTNSVEGEIGRLSGLSHIELKERWRIAFGNPAPKHVSRQLLIKAIAYHLRENMLGVPSAATKRRLREIAVALRNGSGEAFAPGSRIRPGTRLVRAWKGATHIIDVTVGGFEWQGARHRSLSAIAKAITGTNWNGYAFFGVKRRAAKNKNGAGPRRAGVSYCEAPADA